MVLKKLNFLNALSSYTMGCKFDLWLLGQPIVVLAVVFHSSTTGSADFTVKNTN